MGGKYFTVVFEISDRESFQEHLDKFTEALMHDGIFQGASVTGCGWGDSMSESEVYMQELIDNGIDIPEIPE